MKQVIRKGLKEIIVDEVPEPVVKPHHVLVRPHYSLISSGTETADLHQEGILKEVAENPSHLKKIWNVMKANGPVRTLSEVKAKFSEYAALGYSGAGVVVQKHETVSDLSVGDRVAYGGEGTGHCEIVLAGRNLVARIPKTVTLEHACFTTLGSIAMNSVRIANIAIGDVVAVIGLGLVGQLIAQLIRAQGGVVIAIDIKSDRVELSRELGAEHALISGPEITSFVNTLTAGRGVDCVIVAAAAKSSAPVHQAIGICRDRGRLVIVGAVPLELPRDEMYIKELQLFMSRAYGPGSYDPLYEKEGQDYPFAHVRWTENRNMEEFLRLVAAGRVNLEPLITHRFSLEAAAAAYETIMNPTSRSLAVLLCYPSGSNADITNSFQPRSKVSLAESSNKNANLEVALIGAGNLARWVHLPNLNKIAHVKLRCVYSANGVRGKSYAKRFGADYACSAYDEVLNDPNVDVVLIASRHQEHFSQALAALKAGKHVFLEKPMALTEDESRQLYKAVRETGKQLTVGFNRRFAPLYLEQRKVLSQRSGPAVVNCRVNSPYMTSSFWAADPAVGGAILSEACHFVDLMYWMLESEPVAVTAYSLPAHSKEPIGQNNIAASFLFEDGSVANITYCTVGNKNFGGERVEIFAPGVVVMTEDFKRLIVKGQVTRSCWKSDKGYKRQLESFLSGIKLGKEPQVTVRDGARATVGCLRILESARTLTPCRIDLDSTLRLG